MSEPYPSIKNVYTRDPDTNIITTEFSDPVFGHLLKAPWEVTEKLDGTSIRLVLDMEGTYTVRGRTDKSQLPPPLLDYCMGLEAKVRDAYGNSGANVCLYGEGVGKGIQEHGNRYGDEQHFRLFDVQIRRYPLSIWFTRQRVQVAAKVLGIPHAPFLGQLPLDMAISLWLEYPQAPKSRIFDGVPEGWVLRPVGDLRFRSGEPIRVKIKERDFKVLRGEWYLRGEQ